MTIDGVARRMVAWQDWSVTTRIDTAAYALQVWQAIACHRSQLPGYSRLEKLSAEQHRILWGAQTFVRAYSSVNAGRKLETDLFEGLR
jgi:LmbE family N-acetylglucosaminyl deacetylase